MLQASDCVYSESLTPQGKLVACRRDLTEILVCKDIILFVFLSFSLSMSSISTARGYKNQLTGLNQQQPLKDFITCALTEYKRKGVQVSAIVMLSCHNLILGLENKKKVFFCN